MALDFKQTNGSLTLGVGAGTITKAVEEIYVGDSAPTTDGYKVWVKPDADADTTELAAKSYVDEAIADIGGGADIDLTDYYTKQEVDKAINDIDLSSYATESYVDEKFNSIQIPEVDLSGYALKEDIPDTSAFKTEEEIIALIEEYASGEPLPSAEEVEF